VQHSRVTQTQAHRKLGIEDKGDRDDQVHHRLLFWQRHIIDTLEQIGSQEKRMLGCCIVH
jgi:hypothetical protein